jgi:glycosyltransferase involved in cell wall biosynthesis
MRVLTIYYKHRPGGMMQMIYRMLLAGAERDWDMHYLSVAPYAVAHPRLHPHHLPWIGRHESPWFWTWFFSTAPFVVLSLARKNRVDLLAVFEGTYAWATLLAKRLLRLPLVVFLQSDVATINRLHGRPALIRRIEQMMEGAGLRAADRIIVTNQALADIVRERWLLSAAKISIVPNNVRLLRADRSEVRHWLHKAYAVPPDAFLIATSGVFAPRKNLALLLASFAELDAPRAHLLVIGEAPDLDEWHRIRQVAVAARNGDRIHFLGWRNDVARVLAGCDLFVFPSRHEGSPLSLIEALRTGLPCIGSNVPEIQEVLGTSPEVCVGVDDIDGLRARMQRAIDDGQFYGQLRALSAERACRYEFDWEARVTDLMTAAARTSA